jgi:hypothetical protein
MLFPIEIDVQVEGGVRVSDRLLWDLSDGNADPTAVAQVKTCSRECVESQSPCVFARVVARDDSLFPCCS